MPSICECVVDDITSTDSTAPKIWPALYTISSAIAESPRDARVTSIRKIAKWNF